MKHLHKTSSTPLVIEGIFCRKLFRWILAVSICFLSICALSAQTPSTPIKELKVGDTIPDLVVQNIIQSDDKQVKMSDMYKDGLLLIDFWATWCAPCIKLMIQMDTLKKQFPNFHSLSVTYQDSLEVKRFLDLPSNSDINTERLTIVTNDTLLKQYLPHRSLPHSVWIDSMGVIKAITYGRSVTANRIKEFLAEQDLSDKSLIAKNDRDDFDYFKPFHLGDSLFKYRSIITPMISGIGGGNLVNSQYRKIDRFFAWNNNIPALYWAAFSKFQPSLKKELIEIYTKDTLKFYKPSESLLQLHESEYKNIEQWQKENVYCYELVLPEPVSDTTFAKYMIQDLNRFFGFKTRTTEREMQCVVLRSDLSQVNLPPTTQPDSSPFITFQYPKLIATNINMDDLVHYLMGFYSKNTKPIVNKTSCEMSFDLVLDLGEYLGIVGEGISLEMVLKGMKKLGITWSEEIHPYPVLVIEDLKDPPVENKETALESRD